MKVCLEPGCPALSSTTRCPEHQRSKQRADRQNYQRNNYGPRWPTISRRYLRQHTQCQCTDPHCRCQATCNQQATEVDHKVAIKWFANPTAAHHTSNLQALCSTCHKSKTMRHDYPGRSSPKQVEGWG